MSRLQCIRQALRGPVSLGAALQPQWGQPHIVTSTLNGHGGSVRSRRRLSGEPQRRGMCPGRRPRSVSAQLEQFSPNDFSVDRLLGTLGFMNVYSYSPGQWGAEQLAGSLLSGVSIADLNRLAGQVAPGEGSMQIRIYRGRVVQEGPLNGMRVILKAYPGRALGNVASADADALAANELVTHFALQGAAEDSDGDAKEFFLSPHVSVLLGGFETSTGEKWLVFRDDGFLTAADYARFASEATAEGTTVGQTDLLNLVDRNRPIRRRELFILKILRGAMEGLAYMHQCGKLHQSLGPASIVLNTVDEAQLGALVPRLRDLAFSVDISDPAVLAGGAPGPSGSLQEARGNLWRRARSVSASTIFERKAFGLADDIYSAGLFLAYMAFLPLCPPGSIDGPSIQRLLETTFELQISAAREYCAADDRWTRAVAFLDRKNGSGWELLQAMLNTDYRMRPTADSVLRHPFLL